MVSQKKLLKSIKSPQLNYHRNYLAVWEIEEIPVDRERDNGIADKERGSTEV